MGATCLDLLVGGASLKFRFSRWSSCTTSGTLDPRAFDQVQRNLFVARFRCLFGTRRLTGFSSAQGGFYEPSLHIPSGAFFPFCMRTAASEPFSSAPLPQSRFQLRLLYAFGRRHVRLSRRFVASIAGDTPPLFRALPVPSVLGLSLTRPFFLPFPLL